MTSIDDKPFYNQAITYESVQMVEFPKIKRTNSISNTITIIDENQTKINSEIENINNDTNSNINNIINIYKNNDTKCEKIMKKIYNFIDAKYFVGISIIILSIVIAVYFHLLLQKISEFEILLEYIINNKITPLNINSFNDATKHIPILAISMDNISNMLYEDGEQIKKLLRELEKIINNTNFSTK
jgi:hypothetical protein